ncbi:MAG: NAD-dependent deacylase, partial [Bacteroidales bacterium]|nr:NAD-dependent deacylase [Bacteroidales bacterium]
EAAALAREADIMAIIGTSLLVYPAAGLVDFAGKDCPVYVVDPLADQQSGIKNVHLIKEKATTGVSKLKDELLKKHETR